MTTQITLPYTIGFFTTGVELEYSYILFKSVEKVAKERGVNLINFLGGSINPEFTFQQYKYQYQCNVAFNYAHQDHIDGIILASGVLSSFIDTKAYSDFCNNFAPIPMVSLGLPVEDMPSVYTDNRAVFKDLVSHLITHHHRKHIGFITGPSRNGDALDRYKGYEDALRENHLLFNKDYLYTGDFTPTSAIDAIKIFLDQKKLPLDAIVCANDSMAITVLSEVQKRGIKVPEQIAVTGFDNIHSSAYCVPSLSTIEQPFDEFAREAFNLLLERIVGQSTSNKLIPCKLIYRESCGCHQELTTQKIHSSLSSTQVNKVYTLADCFLSECLDLLPEFFIFILRDFVIKMYSFVYANEETISEVELVQLFSSLREHVTTSLHMALNLKRVIGSLKKDLLLHCSNISSTQKVNSIMDNIEYKLFNDILKYYGDKTDHLSNNFSFIRQVLHTTTMHIHDKKRQLNSIIPNLIECGIHSCLIYLYPKEIVHNLTDEWKVPNNLILSMAYIDDCIIDVGDEEYYCPKNILVHGLNTRNKAFTSFVHPIFFGNEQLGVIILELDSESYHLIETLTIELGCALKLSSIFTAQKKTESKLEMLSQTDELTGLLNRRGFFIQADKAYLTARVKNKTGIIFYADMDGLKIINDNFGHHEGDAAITIMSLILQKAFTTQCLIARIGGDEFTVICIDPPEHFIEHVKTSINHFCKLYNETSNKPYNLSISLGILPFDYHTGENLEELLSTADKLLYSAKHAKINRRQKILKETS